ncbi:YbbR-like domain-containing protein [Confluentibacter citreus]|uniref:YbbR-like domain-containing protein n=1 Tax=Confluentibacter citreus TaxID=2007307 RepID=UPI001EFD7001|nr:YbbR-like domain-containing protein [Confluentibacter citreus]
MIRKLKKEILISIRNRKINVFFLFLLLAFIILIFTKLSNEFTNTITFDINKINVPQENVVLNDSNAKLKVTLKTHGFKWLGYYLSKPKINIDFSKDVIKTKSTFIWDKSKAYLYSDEQFGNKVELLNISPDTLVFKYDVNLVKKVPILLNTDVAFVSGFDVTGNYKLNPDSIVVVGPEIIASKVKSVQTEKLTLDDVKSNISSMVKLKLPKNNKDLKFSTNEIQVSATVEKYTEGTLKIPVSVINVPADMTLNYFPKEVIVAYYTSLKDFKAIKAEDFVVECDFSAIENQQAYLTPKLTKISKLVKSAKVNQQRIEFIILE